MLWLKQSTAATVKIGPFVDSTDGVTAEDALTISQADIRLSKNGGAFAQTNNATGATHDENGWYGVPLDTTDTGTLGTLIVAVAESGALPVWAEYMVIPANAYDSLVLGTDVLTADVTQWLGTAAATPTTAGVPEVDITHIAGSAVSTTTAQIGANVVQLSTSATAADNLEASALGIVSSTAAAGTLSTTQMTTNLSEATDDHYNGRVIVWTSGVLAGQASAITDYTGATKLLTYLTVTEAPSASDAFVIV